MSSGSIAAEGLFLDTNILVYAFDRKAGTKWKMARGWLQDFCRGPVQPHLSVQVLQEVHVTLVRKGHAPGKSAALVGDFLNWPVVANTTGVLRSALEIQQRHQLSYWDSSVIAAALEAGCEQMWSGDLGSGRDYGGLTVVNPFEAPG